ncbi:MAG TPA: phosphoribosylanthranilate isomerase, partial [Selenomonas sp.]|nr:phosphoribosylanthranilate isomerase [Selenomonas sp.]
MIVKICGMKTEEAALAAEAAGADLLGFIFYKDSRRYVAPERVKDISAGISHSRKVGVFVDAPISEVNEIAEFCGLDYVQLHGHEDEAYARQVARPVIKAYRYGDNFKA